MLAGDVEKMMRELYEAMSPPHDVEKIASLLTDDCIHEDMGAGDTWEGRETLVAYYKEFFRDTPDFAVDVSNIIVGEGGDWVVMEGVMSGSETVTLGEKTSTGKYRIRVADVVELREGKIRRESTYYDGVTFLRQVGVLPEDSAG